MKKLQLRRYVTGALAIGAVAGASALALPGTHAGPALPGTHAGPASARAAAWLPVTAGLTERPAQLLPATVSTAHPVRIVSTALDDQGRPVVTVHTATDPTAAAALVVQGQRAAHAIDVELDAVATVADVPTGTGTATGTDPFRDRQWDFSKIDVAAAWPKSTGAGAVVAVVDTGVDASHPDLAGQVLPGRDVVNSTTGTSTDANGHGTHVAGTIAALTGNGAGVSAIAPDAKILPIRVMGANGSGYMSDVATGIVYAADNGADVINMSLGTDTQVEAVTNAIGYARSMGVVVVAAAGNDRGSGSPVSYPAADPGVIAVAATDSSDTVAYYSNQGGYVDVAAPGTGIVSTYPGASYRSMSGTSMASPHAAAVAALLKAYDRALTPDQVELALESSAVDLGTAGEDTDYGYGRINAAAALATVTPAPPAPAPPTPTPTSSSTPTPSESPSETTTPAPTETATPAPSETTTPAPSETTTPAPAETPAPTPSETTAPAPSTTPAPTPSATTPIPVITPNAMARMVEYGTTQTPAFTVTAGGGPMAHQLVQVCVSLNSAPYGCTDTTTSDAGAVAWPLRVTTPFRIKLVVPATGTTSATARYQVRAAVTVTPASATSLSIAIGGLNSQTVKVQRLDGARWVTAKTLTAAAELTVTGLKPGGQYRVVVRATPLYAGVTSPVVNL